MSDSDRIAAIRHRMGIGAWGKDVRALLACVAIAERERDEARDALHALNQQIQRLRDRYQGASRTDLSPEADALPTYAAGLLDGLHQVGDELAALLPSLAPSPQEK